MLAGAFPPRLRHLIIMSSKSRTQAAIDALFLLPTSFLVATRSTSADGSTYISPIMSILSSRQHSSAPASSSSSALTSSSSSSALACSCPSALTSSSSSAFTFSSPAFTPSFTPAFTFSSPPAFTSSSPPAFTPSFSPAFTFASPPAFIFSSFSAFPSSSSSDSTSSSSPAFIFSSSSAFTSSSSSALTSSSSSALTSSSASALAYSCPTAPDCSSFFCYSGPSEDPKEEETRKKKKKSHMTEQRRIELFRMERLVGEVFPHAVWCKGCEAWVALDKRRRFYMGMWEKHVKTYHLPGGSRYERIQRHFRETGKNIQLFRPRRGNAP
ncbi:hypothetical protein Ac2012v2_006799 [Leucoagaricus gongylophorus]